MGNLVRRFELKEAGFQLATLFFLVTLCIAITINFHPLYWWFMQTDKLYHTVGLSEQALRQDYLTLLAYLNYPWVTELKLTLPVSYNGMRHFEDVKRLFLLNYSVLVLTLWPAVHYLGTLYKQKKLWRLQVKITAVFMTLFVGACFMLLDFESFFVFFHKVLFRNDDWIFDPTLDPIINALPSEYFMACFVMFGSLFVLSLLALYLIGKRQLKNVVV